jgi:hypothetical protein
VGILNRFKEIFDYNAEAAKFIGDFGTLNDPKER